MEERVIGLLGHWELANQGPSNCYCKFGGSDPGHLWGPSYSSQDLGAELGVVLNP